MPEHAALRRRVEHVLDGFLQEESRELLTISGQLEPLVAQLRTSLARGKRLRPAFCYWGWRAGNQPDCEGIVKAAAAMELVHVAAVVHDDIIDRSAIRHGAPTARIGLRDCFPPDTDEPGRAAGGDALAMLAGDLLMSWAGQLFTSCGLPGAYLSRARPLWATLARELVAGEFLEVLSTGRRTVAADSLDIVRFKTAKYTIERPLHIGGLLAGAPPVVLEAFTAYGIPLGEAFQLRDDILGTFGDPARTGKPDLDDIRGRKPTVLLALTREAAGPRDLRELEHLLSAKELGEEEARGVRALMERTGARKRVEEMIGTRVERAAAVAASAPLPPRTARALRELAVTASRRAD